MKTQNGVVAQQAQQGNHDEVSMVQYRKPVDGDGGWGIHKAPLRRNVAGTVIVNLGCSGGGGVCCVMAGTQVLLADGTTKAVESFVGGERVRTLMGEATVKELEITSLGANRRIIELDAGDGDPLYVSDEHSLWSRSGDGVQWWGTYNFHQYWYETQVGTGSVLENPPTMMRWDIPNEHAHVDGWKRIRPTFCYLAPETPLYHLAVDQGGSYIANGFVVISHCTDELVEGANWEGIELPEQQLPEFKLPVGV
ncbi:hypothetical protein [Pandoraea bronchicola]|uniref:Hint domain-containing protein n=1 Tax=Pandoraea bronchicola TaxID=2508287 RepID=A0A5E5C237_9BURK|nr:hypothetical protein [Pandoraea bronchicola]VVE90710.1 hypothetical protein PBR20603_04697 [Pandoraea bronchicola]